MKTRLDIILETVSAILEAQDNLPKGPGPEDGVGPSAPKPNFKSRAEYEGQFVPLDPKTGKPMRAGEFVHIVGPRDPSRAAKGLNPHRYYTTAEYAALPKAETPGLDRDIGDYVGGLIARGIPPEKAGSMGSSRASFGT